MRHAHCVATVALVAAAALSGCRSEHVARNGPHSSPEATQRVAGLALPSGTSIDVTLATPLTSKTAAVGDTWTGSIRTASVVDGRDVIPAGSSVSGTVTAVKAARKGDRAMLDLGLTSITVDGHSSWVGGSTEAVIAGSPRARNLGAIGAASDGYQVMLKEGTPLTFTTNEAVAVRP